MTRPGMLRQTFVVFRKELTDSSRDRRALFSIVFSILMIPAIAGFTLKEAASREREAENVTIPIVGEENAPVLVQFLREQRGVETRPGPSDPETAVRDQREDVVVVIPKEFAERFRTARPAPVKVVGDSSRASARSKMQRVERLLQAYSGQIASLRLIEHGVSPSIATAVQVQEVEVSSAQQRAATVLGMIPIMLMIAAFVGSMQIATDSTAGERERGSLEALLVNPAPRLAFVSGKWLAATIAAMLTVCVAALLCVVEFRYLPLSDLGLHFRLGGPQMLLIVAAILPMCPFTAALQACIGTLARSFKEAQSYMGILLSLVMLPMLINSVSNVASSTWMYPVPLFGQFMIVQNILGGRTPAASVLILSAGSALLLAAVLVRFTTALFEHERIIFGR